MLFILGVRIYNDLLATVAYVCEHCQQHAAHQVTRRARKITVFFLPLFPMSTKYFDTCTNCGRVLRIPKERAEAAGRQLVW